MIYLIVNSGCWYCGDRRWRAFATFGNGRRCIKEYRRLSAAKRVAARIDGTVVGIESGLLVDSGGDVGRDDGTKVGNVFGGPVHEGVRLISGVTSGDAQEGR